MFIPFPMRTNRRDTRISLVALSLPIAILFGLWLQPGETPIERAYRVCGECGILPFEIDQQIDDARHTTLTREESLALFGGLFERREDAESCRDWPEAVLDAAED